MDAEEDDDDDVPRRGLRKDGVDGWVPTLASASSASPPPFFDFVDLPGLFLEGEEVEEDAWPLPEASFALFGDVSASAAASLVAPDIKLDVDERA